MKTLRTFLIALFVTIFSFTSFSQVINFDVELVDPAKIDTVNIGDIISFTNKTEYNYTFKINNEEFFVTNNDKIGLDISINDTNRIIVMFNFQGTFVKLYKVIVRTQTTAGINDLSNINFNIFPNPTTDFLNISGAQIEALQVFDVNGRLVLSETPNASNLNLDVRSLETGFYTVLVNNQQTLRFIKE